MRRPSPTAMRNLVVYALEGPLRGRRRRHRGARPRDRARAARPGPRAMTWSWPSAATARSTKPPTACAARRSPLCACRAARPTCSQRCSAFPASWSTRPSTCWRWPTTGACAASTSASSTVAASRSTPASASTRASSSASTRDPQLKARFGPYFFTWQALVTVRAALPRAPAEDATSTTAGARCAPSPRSCRTARRSPTSTNRPIEIADGASLDSGRWPAPSLHRATPLGVALDRHARAARRARASSATATSPTCSALSELTVRSADGRPLPLQVDGDFLGEVTRRATRSCRRAHVVS